MKSLEEKGDDIRTYTAHTSFSVPTHSPHLLTHSWAAAWRVGRTGMLPALVRVIGLDFAHSPQCHIFLPQGQPCRRKQLDATDSMLKKAGKRSSPTPSPEDPAVCISF